MKKRILSLVMVFCMIFSMLPMPAHAADNAAEQNLCDHHTGHTEECGYSEETLCGYVCEECTSEPDNAPPHGRFFH